MAHSSTRNLPPLDSLVAALTAARLGSFSAAALELGITHAAISRRVAVAESWAGQRLFDRHGRGVTATLSGQRILARVELAFDQIAIFARSERGRRTLPVVRVGVTPSFARFWLLPRLKTLEGKPADIRIEVIADLKHANLRGGEIDLAVRYGRGGWRVGSEERLLDERLVPVAAATLLMSATRVTPGDVAGEVLLHDGDATSWRAWSEAHVGSWKPKVSDRVLADYALAIEAAGAGLGVALWNLGLHDPPAGLALCRHLETPSPLAHYLIRRPGDSATPAGRVAARILEASQLGSP